METQTKNEEEEKGLIRGCFIASIVWMGIIATATILNLALDLVRLEFGNTGWRTMVLTLTLLSFLIALTPSIFYELNRLVDNRKKIFKLEGL